VLLDDGVVEIDETYSCWFCNSIKLCLTGLFIGFLITQQDESCKNKCYFVVNPFMIYVVISLTDYIASNDNGINEE